MFRRVKNIQKIVACVIILMIVPMIFASSSYARTATDVEKMIANKVLSQGVYRCYTDGFVTSEFNPIEGTYHDINDFVTAAASKNGNYVPLVTGLNSSSIWKMANYEVGDSGLSCQQFFVGGGYGFGGASQSILQATKHTAPQIGEPAKVVEFLGNMGYKIEDIDSGGSDPCFALKYILSSTGKEYTTNPVCQNNVGELRAEGTTTTYGGYTFKSSIRFGIGKTNEVCLFTPNGGGSDGGGISQGCKALGSGEEFDGAWLQSVVGSVCGSATCHVRYGTVKDGGDEYDISFVDSLGDDAIVGSESLLMKKASFINNSSSEAALQAIRFLFGLDMKTPGDIMFKNAETRLLYQDYLTSYYKVNVNCGASSGSFYRGQIWWYNKSSKSMEQCYYETSKAENVNKPVNGIASGMIQYENIANLEALLKIFETDELGHEYSESELEELDNISGAGSYENDTDGGNGRNDACYDGSGSLGWLICPVIKMVSGIGEYMWGVIEENLQIPAEGLFKNTTGVRDAWDAIRNISNILFVILFLFVIFSQLTGIGIDNYGIKRILPKLILVAILINLSYIICELAVDLSNILGMGLNSLLMEQADKISVPAAMSTGDVIGGWIVSSLLAGGGVTLFLLLNPAGAIVAAAGLGLAVLGLLITTIVSIFFMYVTLVVRQAGVILMIVLAPIALACYLLPNTEKLFKKWFDLFKALLIVYPICGALIGAGQLAGAVLASINTPSMRVAAMLVQVVPFFLLPMIIRNSLSLMGNIGGRLSTWGRNLGRRGSNFAQGQIRNSRGYQEWSRYQQDRSSVARANRIRERLGNRTNLTERQRLQLLDAERTINAQTQKNAEAQVGEYMLDSNLAVSRMQSAKEAKEYRAYQDQFAGFDQSMLRAQAASASTWIDEDGGTQRMMALIGAMESAGMERDIFTMLKNTDVGGKAGVMSVLAGSKNKVLKAYGKKGAGMDYKTFMSGNGAQSMQAYIRDKGRDFIDGLDDKALAEIANVNVNGVMGGAMSTELLIDAAARINSQDAVDQLDSMLITRNDIKLTGEQLVNLNRSTASKLMSNANARTAILTASDDVASDPRLIAKLDATTRKNINALRTGGLGGGRAAI